MNSLHEQAEEYRVLIAAESRVRSLVVVAVQKRGDRERSRENQAQSLFYCTVHWIKT